MAKPIKRLLAGGGIAALAAGYALFGGNGEEELTSQQKQAVVSAEYANAKVGEELPSLRTINTKRFKTATGKQSIRIYSGKQHYLDSEDGKYKEYDVRAKDISEEAKEDPKRTHDKYVDPGADAPKTTWFNGKEYDYTFKDQTSDYSFTLEALYDTGIVTHNMKYNKFGTELFVVIDDQADANSLSNTLSWKITSNANYQLEPNDDIVFTNDDGNFLFKLTAPWMRDSDLHYYYNSIDLSLNGDVFTYTLNIPPNATFPITVDPSVTIQTVQDVGHQAISREYNDGDGTSARDTTASIGTWVGGNNIVGQLFGAPLYYVDRSHLLFDITGGIPNVLSVTSGSLYIYLDEDHSDTDFAIRILRSFFYDSSVKVAFNDFYGWDTSGAYNTDSTMVDTPINTSTMSAGTWVTFPFGSTGLTVIDGIVTGAYDTLKITMLSEEDVTESAPTDGEWVLFSGSTDAGEEPYIGLQYTSISPTGFAMTQVDDDQMQADWNDVITGETGYRIIQSPYSGPSDYVDSVGAGVETITVSGLIPNTQYTWKVQVIHADIATVSGEDAEYTLANLPSLIVAVKNDSTVHVFADTLGTGNPSTTQYAFRENAEGVFIYPVATPALDTLTARNASWNTLANWGITNCATDCLEVYLRYGAQDGAPDTSIIGHTFSFQVNARTDG